MRRVAVPGAVVQSAVATALGALLAHALGWSWSAGLVFGIALAVASTVVLIRVLADNNDAPHAEPATSPSAGWSSRTCSPSSSLVVLPAIFGGARARHGSCWLALALTGAQGGRAWWRSRAVGRHARRSRGCSTRSRATRSRELFTLTVLVLALGIAVGSAALFGVSMALGAFLAGHGRRPVRVQPARRVRGAADARRVRRAVLRLGRHAARRRRRCCIARAASPARWRSCWSASRVVARSSLVRTSAIRSRRRAGGRGGARADRRVLVHPRHARARDSGCCRPDAMNAIVAASIVSIVLNPLFYRCCQRDRAAAFGSAALWRLLNASAAAATERDVPTGRRKPRHRAVVVGIRADRPDGDPPAAGQRHRADGRSS